MCTFTRNVEDNDFVHFEQLPDTNYQPIRPKHKHIPHPRMGRGGVACHKLPHPPAGKVATNRPAYATSH